MQLKIKKLSDVSFVLSCTKTSRTIALVSMKDNKFHVFGQKDSFDTLDELASNFNAELVFDETENENTTAPIIDGIQIKHDEAFDIQEKSIKEVNVFTYSSKKGSSVRFCAGYFGIQGKSLYSQSFCPKDTTLLENNFIGPYKSKFDLLFHITKANKGEL